MGQRGNLRTSTFFYFQVDIESVKTAASVYAPAGITLKEVNKKLSEAPEELTKENAEESAWLIKV